MFMSVREIAACQRFFYLQQKTQYDGSNAQKNARLIRPGQNVVFGWAKTSEFDNNSRLVVVIGSQHVTQQLPAYEIKVPSWQGADFPLDYISCK